MKLDVKELIAKLISGYGTPTIVDLGSNWTPTTDGIVNVVVGWNNNTSNGYVYIKDYTADEWVGMISNVNSLGGYLESTSIPVLKGHTYKVGMQNNASTITAKFFPIS